MCEIVLDILSNVLYLGVGIIPASDTLRKGNKMTLADQVKADKTLRSKLVERITDFQRYLSGTKFHNDTTVQTWEVQRFLTEFKSYVEERNSTMNANSIVAWWSSSTPQPWVINRYGNELLGAWVRFRYAVSRQTAVAVFPQGTFSMRSISSPSLISPFE
jgi:hypothetical protein